MGQNKKKMSVRRKKEKEIFMDAQQKRKLDKMIFRFSLLPLAVGLVYMFYSALKRKELGIDYYVVLILCLGLHWLVSDVISMICIKGFEGKTEAQKKAYRIYALLNLAGFAGLGYFAVSVGNNTGIWGALVYIMTLNMKRKYLDEYRGIVKKEKTAQEKQEDSEAVTEESEVPEIEEIQPQEENENE